LLKAVLMISALDKEEVGNGNATVTGVFLKAGIKDTGLDYGFSIHIR